MNKFLSRLLDLIIGVSVISFITLFFILQKYWFYIVLTTTSSIIISHYYPNYDTLYCVYIGVLISLLFVTIKRAINNQR